MNSGTTNFLSFSRLKQYPALSVGLVVFTFILVIFNYVSGGALSRKFSLHPNAMFELDLNRVSLYLLFHQGFIHFALNCAALFAPLAAYERTHGTVYTGITLNLLAVVTAIQYSLVGKLLYPNTQVVGLSGVVFLFMSYSAYQENQHTQYLNYKFQGRDISFPTLYLPFIFLVICLIIFPGSSFWGHLAGISTGYMLALGYLKFLFPPLKVILFIEQKLSGLIDLIDGIVTYYREEDAINTRNLTYIPFLSSDIEAAHEGLTSASTEAFRGPGNVLGTS